MNGSAPYNSIHLFYILKEIFLLAYFGAGGLGCAFSGRPFLVLFSRTKDCEL